jgi:4,5-DOPA dioxygenase extradiol
MSGSAIRMPVLFVGHGSPMNALEENSFTRVWRTLGRALPRPRAILAISAHWMTRGSAVTAQARPATIHDFGGFPAELFAVEYPAPGDPQLAREVQQILAPEPIGLDVSWGLDHGTWSVLVHAYPDATIPVVQLSLDLSRPAAELYRLAQGLGPLRRTGVLVIGSGNVVHNLRMMRFGPDATPYPWAERFEMLVRGKIEERAFGALLEGQMLGEDARLAIPTPEHYLPLLYCVALAEDDDSLSFPTSGIVAGSISMLSVAIGAT